MSRDAGRPAQPLTDEILLLPTSVRPVTQEQIYALDAKRVRRLRELGSWRPSRGWQIEPALAPGARPDGE